MARPNSVRLGALFGVVLGCSSQSIEAVGVVPCLKTPEFVGCAGGGGAGAIPGTGGAAAGTGGSGADVAAGGVAGSANAGAPGAGEGSLVHRYSFDGNGTVAVDSVGNADGAVVNTLLDGAGAVSVADDGIGDNQTADEFVDLPNQLISGLRSATLEVWLTWAGAGSWQRIFDFGDDTSGIEGVRSTGYGRTYLFLTPQSADLRLPRVAFAAEGVHEVRLDATRALPRNAKAHVAVVIDSEAERMLLYIDGALENSMAFPANRLAQIRDVNNWLGRSNYFYDPGFTGIFHEFRVYAAALTAAQVRESFSAGSEAPVPGL